MTYNPNRAGPAIYPKDGVLPIIPDDWQPTAANIKALPRPLQSYIHDLHTRCDPTGDVQTIWSQREQIGGLLARVRELEGVVGRWLELHAIANSAPPSELLARLPVSEIEAVVNDARALVEPA